MPRRRRETIEETEDIEPEIEARLTRLREDPELARRYDVTGDGLVDEREWELVRRMITLELKTRRRQHGRTASTSTGGEVIRGRYETIGMLGRGGQGVTYLARDLERDEHVVVKELSLHAANHWKAIELFEREGEVLESLRHPRIPSYIDAFAEETDDGVRFFLVQEHVFGDDLEAAIAQHRWTADEAWDRLAEISRVLAYLHSLQPPVIHRDIKPSNIVVASQTGALHLVDFGAAQNVAAETVGGSTVVGTSGYVPMEQYMGKAAPASDIYALGATMVHCLTGVAPIDLDMNRGRLEFESRIGDDRFVRLLSRMLEPFPEERIASGIELQRTLREMEGDQASRALVRPRQQVPREQPPNEPVLSSAMAAVASDMLSADEPRAWLSVQVDHAEHEVVREISTVAALVERPLSAELHVSDLPHETRRTVYQIAGAIAVCIALLMMISGGSGLFAGPFVGLLIVGTLWLYLQTRWTHWTFDDVYVRGRDRQHPIDHVTTVKTDERLLTLRLTDGGAMSVDLPPMPAAARVYLEQVLTETIDRLKRGEQLDPTDRW